MSKEKQRKAELLARDKDEALLGRRLLDLDNLCGKRYSPVSTFFLTETEQAYSESVFHMLDSYCRFMGGYDGAERNVAILLPSEEYELSEDEIPFKALKLEFAGDVGHRDIMGSVLGLGIERNAIGDILVLDNRAYIYAMNDMASFIERNLTKIGRQNVSVSECEFDDVEVPERKTEDINATVASLRLDAVIAESFRLSRETAKTAVERQLVQLNHRIVESPSHNIKEKDIISLRGKGKIILESVSGESKKGRIWVKILKFV